MYPVCFVGVDESIAFIVGMAKAFEGGAKPPSWLLDHNNADVQLFAKQSLNPKFLEEGESLGLGLQAGRIDEPEARFIYDAFGLVVINQVPMVVYNLGIL